MPVPRIAPAGFRLPNNKMAFALITKGNKGKIKVQKIGINSES